ncbi:hypothetical protein SprV_0100229000 [Sparganum proliferum]
MAKGTLIQQRAFLRTVNRTAYDAVHSLTGKICKIRDLINTTWNLIDGYLIKLRKELDNFAHVSSHQAVTVYSIPAAKISATSCRKEMQELATTLYRYLASASEKWKSWAQQSEDLSIIGGRSSQKDLELLVIDSFFLARGLGSGTRSLLRGLTRNLLEIRLKSYSSLRAMRNSSQAHEGSLTRIIINSQLQPSDPLLCRRFSELSDGMISHIDEQISNIVTLIDQINYDLRTLTAWNRDLRASFVLSKNEPTSPYLSKLVTATFNFVSQSRFRLNQRKADPTMYDGGK